MGIKVKLSDYGRFNFENPDRKITELAEMMEVNGQGVSKGEKITYMGILEEFLNEKMKLASVSGEATKKTKPVIRKLGTPTN